MYSIVLAVPTKRPLSLYQTSVLTTDTSTRHFLLGQGPSCRIGPWPAISHPVVFIWILKCCVKKVVSILVHMANLQHTWQMLQHTWQMLQQPCRRSTGVHFIGLSPSIARRSESAEISQYFYPTKLCKAQAREMVTADQISTGSDKKIASN